MRRRSRISTAACSDYRWPAVTETDVTGHVVRTAPHLLSFRDWIVERAGAFPGRRIVNATGAGLLSGRCIEQQRASAVLAHAPALDRKWIHQQVRTAH